MSEDQGGGNVFSFPRIGLRPPVESSAVAVEEPAAPMLYPQVTARRLVAPQRPDPMPRTIEPAAEPTVFHQPATPVRETAALSMLTMAAISVAAMRGSYHVVSWLKGHAEQVRARRKGDSATGSSGAKPLKALLPGPEFGRQSLKRGKSGGGGSGGGGVPSLFRGSGGGSSASRKSSPKSPAGSPAGGPSGSASRPGGKKSPAGSAGKQLTARAGRLPKAGKQLDGKSDTVRGGPKKRSGTKGAAGGSPVSLIKKGLQNRKAKKPGEGGGGSGPTSSRGGKTRTPGTPRTPKPVSLIKKPKRKPKTAAPKTPKVKAPKPAKTPKPPRATKGPKSPKPPSAARSRWERLKAKASTTGPSTPPPGSPGGSSRKPGGSTGPTGPKAGPRARRGGPTPPPGMTQPETVILTRLDKDKPAPRPPAAALAPSKGTSMPLALTAGVPLHQPSTHSDLTIYDLVDADHDAAHEILDRADEARAVALACDDLQHHLDNLKAQVQEMKIPGLLIGYVNRLMEKATQVRNSAAALAAALPQASEAISTAGDNAAARHQHPADVTRDMGHAAPAETDYHKE